VASGFFLDGAMIPRNEQRSIDERAETRHPAVSNTAVLEFRGRKHVVRLINLSRSGAMISFQSMPNIGEAVAIHLSDRGRVCGNVCWVRDGRIGVNFAAKVD